MAAEAAMVDKAALRVTLEAPGRSDNLRRVIGAIVASALFVGIGGFLVGLCGLDVASISPAICACAGFGAVAFCSAISGRGRLELFCYLGLAAVLAIAAIVGYRQIADGGAAVLNSIASVIGSKTARYDLPYVVSSDTGIVVFAAFASALLGVACAQMALRGNVVVCTVLALLGTVCIVLGYAGASAITLVFAAAVIGCFCMNTSVLNQISDGRSVVSTLAFTLVLAAALAAAFFGAARLAGGTDAIRAPLSQALDVLVYGNESWAMPDGQLHDLGALQSSSRAALTVATDASQKEYLRGFVGENYLDDTWGKLSDDTVKDSSGLFYWLSQDGFSTQSQLSSAAVAAGYAGAAAGTMRISYQGARKDYAYLPYSYLSGAQLDVATDQSEANISTERSDGVSISLENPILRKSYLLQESLAGAQSDSNGALQKYFSDETAYRQFVYDNYLVIPSTAESTFEDVLGTPRKLSVEEAKIVIQTFLDQTVSYDTSAVTENGSTDFVSYFLTQSKSGYDVHYATATALLLRYFGIPSRYVEGYYLDMSDGDSGGTVQLTEANAHAWAEYYLDGVGWIPFDTTPGYADASFYESTENTQQYDLSDLKSFGLDSSSSWTPQVEEEQTQETPEEQSSDNPTGTFSGPMLQWMLLGILLALLVGLVARTVSLRRRLSRMLARFARGSAKKQVPRMFSYALFLGERCLGCAFSNAPYASQAQAAEESGMCSAEAFALAADANERALFSGEATEDDRAATQRLVKEVLERIGKAVGPAKKTWYRWISCIFK